jgi:octopine/nopaline transport system substrate-binding protein
MQGEGIRMTRRAWLVGLVLAALWAGSAAAQMPQRVRIATDGASPPWSQLRPDGTLEGFEIDFYPILCERMRVTCEITAQSFDGLIPSLNVGKFDAIMASMSATPKREEVIAFSVPYGATGNTFATVKGSPLEQMPGAGTVLSLAGDDASVARAIDAMKPLLQGRTIGVQSASVSAAFANRYLKDFATIREYKTTQEHDLDLLAGRLDAIVAGRTYLGAAMKQPGYDRLVLVGPNLKGGVLGRGVSIGMRKSDTALKAGFDQAIQSAAADGTIARLSQKWFGFDITPR